jgi:hypothetical protein
MAEAVDQDRKAIDEAARNFSSGEAVVLAK